MDAFRWATTGSGLDATRIVPVRTGVPLRTATIVRAAAVRTEVTTPCGTFSQYVGYFCANWNGTHEESVIYINQGDLGSGHKLWGSQILLHEYGHAIQWTTQNLGAQRL